MASAFDQPLWDLEADNPWVKEAPVILGIG